jgi:hypothetical protein
VSRTGTVLDPIQILQLTRSNQNRKRGTTETNPSSVKTRQNIINMTGDSNGNNNIIQILQRTRSNQTTKRKRENKEVINLTGNSNGNNNVLAGKRLKQ